MGRRLPVFALGKKLIFLKGRALPIYLENYLFLCYNILKGKKKREYL